jgi:hypothetical protein
LGGERVYNGNVFCLNVKGIVLNCALQNDTVILMILCQMGRGFVVSDRKFEVPFVLTEPGLLYYIF